MRSRAISRGLCLVRDRLPPGARSLAEHIWPRPDRDDPSVPAPPPAIDAPATNAHAPPETIAVMGGGMVGGTLARHLVDIGATTSVFDPPKGFCDLRALGRASIVFIAVPTPHLPESGGFDDTFLHEAISSIPWDGKIIVIKSTVLPGTTERFQTLYRRHRFMFNPEFLTEATADHDMRHPTRQILGVLPESAADAPRVMRLLPRAPFEQIVGARVAEFVKLGTNSFYALKVAYCNQLYDLCLRAGIDYEEFRKCIAADPMIGANHTVTPHKDFRGYGGKCLPKDSRSMIQLGEQFGIPLTLLTAARTYNDDLIGKQPGAKVD